MVGSRTAKTREPRQVLTEATVSGHFRVLRGSLTGAGYRALSWRVVANKGCTTFFLIQLDLLRPGVNDLPHLLIRGDLGHLHPFLASYTIDRMSRS